MQIQVQANPNCEGSEQFVFTEIEPPRVLRGLKTMDRGQEIICEVVGVEAGGGFTDAHVVKITDSGEGFAYLIYGGDWGIRIRPSSHANEAWSLQNARQWGESFKIYGSEEDIIF